MHSEVTGGIVTFPVFQSTGIIWILTWFRSTQKELQNGTMHFPSTNHAAVDLATHPVSPPSYPSARLVHQDKRILHAVAT